MGVATTRQWLGAERWRGAMSGLTLWTLNQVMRRYCARGHGVVTRACTASTAVVVAPTAPVAVDARPSLAMTPLCWRPGRSVCRDSARGHSVHRTAYVTTSSAVPAATYRDGRHGVRGHGMHLWRRSCHGSRQGSAGDGGRVGSGGLLKVVHRADWAPVRGALEEQGEVVMAAAKVISVAVTTASAKIK